MTRPYSDTAALTGIYAIERRGDGVRIGTVMRVAGEPVATRWWGYSIHRRAPDAENRAGHRTRKEAVAWVVAQDHFGGGK